MRVIFIVIFVLILCASGYMIVRETYNAGHDEGYSLGHTEGHADGYVEAVGEFCDKIEKRLNRDARKAVCN